MGVEYLKLSKRLPKGDVQVATTFTLEFISRT